MVVWLKINRLCKKLGLPYVSFNHNIFNITDDSRQCIDNSIFFAIKGNNNDGHEFINDAIKNGAVTIFLENKVKHSLGVNYVYVNNTKKYLALALKIYYNIGSKRLKIIGVIGTNGKTTTSTLIYNFLRYINYNAMLIGTNGCYSKNLYNKLDNTTPNIVELYRYFNHALHNNIKYIIMEVSSIAVSELRVLGIDFNTLIYTNFSEDHLDYHKNMDRYLFAKLIPFYKLNDDKNIILNIDDENSQFIIKHSTCNIYGFSIFNDSKYKASNIMLNENGLEMDINDIHIRSNLIGKFNAYNILPLFSLCDILGINKIYISEFINQFKSVNGRMNLIDVNKRFVLIDYAHTESAIKNVISEIKFLAKNKIFIILGCGGNRERQKRYKIGKLLDEEKCINIITSDNSRFEKPMDIIKDIVAGFKEEPIILVNRKEAIKYALNNSKENDYILILGKGCENYIDVNGIKEPYSDLDTIKEYMNNCNHNINW